VEREWCGDRIESDERVAADLPKAERRANPETAPVPVLQRAAEPIEAVAERQVIAHDDREIANLITERTLEYCEGLYPVFPFCLCSHVLQRRGDVGLHHFWGAALISH